MPSSASCLVVLNPGAEEIETLAVADVLVRAGVKVTIAASDGDGQAVVRGSRELPLSSDCSLAEVNPSDFSAVFIPGGVGSAEYARDNATLQQLIAEQLASPRTLAMICAAPISLVPQGLAAGRKLTSYPSTKEHLEANGAQWINERVVWDGNLVTSQGPGTAIYLGLSLAEKLTSADTAQEVAAGMLVDWAAA